MKIQLWTDGACRNNQSAENKGGWGFLVKESNKEIYSNSGAEKNTTNNRMEMMAVIEGVSYILQNYQDAEIEVTTDSAYIANCYKNKWYVNWEKNQWKNAKKEPVKNKELWLQIIPFFKNEKIKFNWVKGHAESAENHLVDMLATNAADSL